MSVPIVFKSLKEFNNWFASGGEHRAGLPSGYMAPLNTSVVGIRAVLRQVIFDLERLQKEWTQIESGAVDGRVRVYFSKFIVDLANLHNEVDDLLTKATKIRVEVQSTRPTVRSHIKDDQNSISKAEQELVNARNSQDQARRNLQAAKAELSGDKGILNGFLTGITFTAYNPLKDNVNKANNAVATINATIQNMKTQVQVLRQSTSELQESNYLLDNLNSVNSALTDYQNLLVKAETSLQEGHEDAEKATGNTSERLSAYYKKQAGKEMNELFSWIGAFKATR